MLARSDTMSREKETKDNPNNKDAQDIIPARTSYASDDYEAAGRHLETLSPEECHPALYQHRAQIIERLYQASRHPDAETNKQLLAGVRFLSYGAPRK
jgi:hypothetical protein